MVSTYLLLYKALIFQQTVYVFYIDIVSALFMHDTCLLATIIFIIRFKTIAKTTCKGNL